jgi:hypothetical protein
MSTVLRYETQLMNVSVAQKMDLLGFGVCRAKGTPL